MHGWCGWSGGVLVRFVCLFPFGCVILNLIPCFQVDEDGQGSSWGQDDVGKAGQTTTYVGRSFSVVTGRVGRLYYE